MVMVYGNGLNHMENHGTVLIFTSSQNGIQSRDTVRMGFIVKIWHLASARCKTEEQAYVSEVGRRSIRPDIIGEPLG